MGENFDVILAAYPAAQQAQADFDTLVTAVRGRQVRSEGVILIEHDPSGQVKVRQTGDRLGRKGAGWGGGVGLLVGLFSPPLLASVVAGGAAGDLIGRFAKHRVATGVEHGLGDKLPPGGAAIIAMIDEEDRTAAQRALVAALATQALGHGAAS